MAGTAYRDDRAAFAGTGCRILLAQKAFSNYDLYPVLQPYLAGTEASGLYEARLGAEEMPDREAHVFCAAYRAEDIISPVPDIIWSA